LHFALLTRACMCVADMCMSSTSTTRLVALVTLRFLSSGSEEDKDIVVVVVDVFCVDD